MSTKTQWFSFPVVTFIRHSSLDGIMGVKEYYNVDPLNDTINSPKLERRMLSGGAKIHGCPECRKPLRDISTAITGL